MRRERDARIDLWRGVALLVIFANHIPGTRFEGAHKALFLSDAAEVFVLLAGVSASHAYWPRFSGDPLGVTMRAWSRAFQLYAAHLATIVMAIALIALAGADERAIEMYGLAPLSADPLATLGAIATLGHQLPYFDILPLYVVLLLLAPGLLALARLGIAPLLAASGALYLAVPLAGLALPGEPGFFFNPFSWQLLFALGLAYGIASRDGRRAPDHPALVAIGCALLLAAAAWKTWASVDPGWLLTGLGKRTLALPRVAHVVVLAYVVARAPGLRAFGREAGWWSPLALVGRHSLPIFCFGSLLSVGGYLLRTSVDDEPWLDVLYVALGVAAHLGLAAFLEWRREGFPRAGRAVALSS